jgi:hypothetical protein
MNPKVPRRKIKHSTRKFYYNINSYKFIIIIINLTYDDLYL